MESLAGVLSAFSRRRQRQAQARWLVPVRRISRVAPVPGRRLVAMTFDDGPTAAPCRPGGGKGVTEAILEALAAYGARATFNVIGTTAPNYPDVEGKRGTVYWSGVKYDHYPAFGEDHLAGVANQPELVRRILAAGHELANHGYRHIAFGPPPWPYGSRQHLPNLAAVVEDLRLLHDLVQQEFGYAMSLARPPHYIDQTADGSSAYSAYAVLGYNYLAASFDGGGWKPSCGSYRRDVKAMVARIRKVLARNPEALNGQIIFQKDGYNMSKESPVVDALPQQLEILRRYDYEVVSVSELLALSPFADLPNDHFAFPAAKGLLEAGYPITYRDNTIRPTQYLTRAELAAMILPWPWPVEVRGLKFKDVSPDHPYAAAIQNLCQQNLLNCQEDTFQPDIPITWSELLTVGQRFNFRFPTPPPPPRKSGPVMRAVAVAFLGPLLTRM
ncbi:MAG: polysaccharide deacetylase family protein [Clostridia bacterium]|nr:polysaccharide deacetylase family protein [Clostridia bacterium]